MSMPPNTWMPREQWDRLARGVHCPVCQELQSTVPVNEYGTTITDLPMSRLRLASNQFVRGYCVLICKRHVQEPYHLPRTQYLQFFADMTLVGQALDRVFQPLKMNFNLLGNAIPHLHAHILPRYYGDAAPHRPIDPNMETVRLGPEETEARVEAIREALAMLATTLA
jgi:diadenosine tetraphosphate (Ap4A) HIT family hydrolase